LNQDGITLAASIIKENLNHLEVSSDITQGLNNITKIVTNLDKDLETVKVVTSNSVKMLTNYGIVLKVILAKSPGKGEYV
jgi:hypothetical protein